MTPKILVIVGPTASGKSDLAVKLAKKHDGEVISADSRQVYKGLNIGTGKITKREMKGVKHHLLDVANPSQRFTVSDYTKIAEGKIKEILSRGKVPIICGGTGFYIDALLGDKQIPEVPPNLALRGKLENKSVEELFKMLQKLDPERAKNIEKQNPRRLIRALEIINALGKVPRVEPRIQNLEANKYEAIKIGVKIEDQELKNRINKRLEKRLKIGMINEAKKLHAKGLSYKRMRELGLEYRYLADLLEDKINKKELKEKLEKEIWQYAKRQMTWFKKNKNIRWFTPTEIERLHLEFTISRF